MKKMILFLYICILAQSITLDAYASESCGDGNSNDVYTCRVENICSQFKSEKPVYASEDYIQAGGSDGEYYNQVSNAPALDTVKRLYRENMGNIYKCGIIQAQRNSLNKISNFIKQEQSGALADTLGGQIENRLNRMEIQSNTIGCSLTDRDTIQNKLNILRETSHEACKYVSYLELLKKENSSLGQTMSPDRLQSAGINRNLTTFSPERVGEAVAGIQNDIATEIAHTYKVFPIAYHAYSEYENNFQIHFLLEIIKADFLVLRKTLHQALMPLAQTGLKVINAMSY